MKKQEKILYKYVVERSIGAKIFFVFFAVLFVVFGTIGWIMPIVDTEFLGWLAATGIGYPIGIILFFASFGACRKYIVSNRSVSISKGLATDLEFPADSIIGIKMRSFISSVTIATAAGKFTVFGMKDSEKCFDALKTVIYERQEASEAVGASTAPKFDDELPDL